MGAVHCSTSSVAVPCTPIRAAEFTPVMIPVNNGRRYYSGYYVAPSYLAGFTGIPIVIYLLLKLSCSGAAGTI